MKVRLNSIQRITALYVIFFAVIVVCLVMAFASTAFSEGFKAGYSDAAKMIEHNNAGETVQIVYDVPAAPEELDFEIPLYRSPSGQLIVSGRPSTLDLEIIRAGKKGIKGLSAPMVFSILSFLLYAAIFVIILMILTSLRRSVRQGNLMERSVIPRTRLIGLLLILASLAHSLSGYLEKRALAPYFEEAGYTVMTSFPLNFSQIITGVLIFVIAEIFAVGYVLSEEQKLTI